MDDTNTFLNNRQLEKMLEFETQILLDIVHNDGLIIAAKGLLLNHVILNLFRIYNDPGNLVIVLNYSDAEQNYFKTKLCSEHVHVHTFATNVTEREDTYLSGGIQFVTTRILVVDLLKRRIPIEKITGIIVLRAHQVLESCQEAFVLRLYRQHNKTGFIKAFSNSPQSFTVGFSNVERIMRALFVKELYIWPRFHSLVIKSLKQHEPKLVELHIPISSVMSKIQTCILDLMNLTVKELKRLNTSLELQEITVENCLTKQFHKTLQSQFDFVWHQVSAKSRQLIADLKTLRHLLITMMYTDPVTFYSLISEYRSVEYAQTSTWVLLEPAETLFTYAKQLVFSDKGEFNPEFCPKWQALSEILKVEILEEIKSSENSESNNTILILCQDIRTCFQLNQFLTQGPHQYLLLMALKKGVTFKQISEKFKNCEKFTEIMALNQKEGNKRKSSAPSNFRKKQKSEEAATTSESNQPNDAANELEELENLKNSYLLTVSQTFCEGNELNTSQYTFEPFSQMENMNLTQLCELSKTKTDPTIIIQTLSHTENHSSLHHILEETKPRFIVMYHSDMSAVRQIELYEAHREKSSPLKVYFLVHAGTVEEQSYLTMLRREKEAFEYLIQTRSTMVVPEDQDGKSEQPLSLQRDSIAEEKNTRQGGLPETTNNKRIVIVDMREFRSELPALIHKRGFEIEPVTITVGDYIITPEVCVERKSISDLIGSLNNGRLYQQCTQMSRYYAMPMLLIEFDQNKPFCWENHHMLSKGSTSFEVQQKLLLLTLHFPKLKIVWSPSPYASAQLFEELKVGKPEPDVEYAANVGNEQDMDLVEAKYNVNIYDFVQKLPGITAKNIDCFLRNVKNLDAAVRLNLEELKEILGSSTEAESLYTALHEHHVPKENADTQKKSKPLKKFKNIKK